MIRFRGRRLPTSAHFIALYAACLLAATSSALAGNLHFDQVPEDGGSLAYLGEGGSLIGSNIKFGQITGDDTPLNAGDTLFMTDGRLNFETGANLLEPPGIYAWGGGGYFTLTADTVKDSLSNDIITPGNDVVILSGYFVADEESGFAVVGLMTGPTNNRQIQISSAGIDQKNPFILDYFGLAPTDFVFAATEISAAGVEVFANKGFNAIVADADIVNTPNGGPIVPEPSSALLAVIAAAGVFGLRRRMIVR